MSVFLLFGILPSATHEKKKHLLPDDDENFSLVVVEWKICS
jgi:hypothetical protein